MNVVRLERSLPDGGGRLCSNEKETAQVNILPPPCVSLWSHPEGPVYFHSFDPFPLDYDNDGASSPQCLI